jgi:hypothetical protein
MYCKYKSIIVKVKVISPKEMHFRRVCKIAKTDYKFLYVCPSVRPSFHTEQLEFHSTDFDKTWYLNIFSKICRENKILLKSDKNNGHFIYSRFHVISLNSS